MNEAKTPDEVLADLRDEWRQAPAGDRADIEAIAAAVKVVQAVLR